MDLFISIIPIFSSRGSCAIDETTASPVNSLTLFLIFIPHFRGLFVFCYIKNVSFSLLKRRTDIRDVLRGLTGLCPYSILL